MQPPEEAKPTGQTSGCEGADHGAQALQSGLQQQARSALRPRLSAATVSGPDAQPRQQMGALKMPARNQSTPATPMVCRQRASVGRT